MPLLAIVLGVAGLIPFVVCGLGALSVDGAAAARMLAALIGYGAVILSFLGGVHWGFALSPDAPEPPAGSRLMRARLVLGVMPSLIGWLALLLQMLLMEWTALAVLIAGLMTTVLVEHQASRQMLIPKAGYIWLRWGLTIGAVSILVTVLTLRVLGQKIY